jgi:hypothetical protein
MLTNPEDFAKWLWELLQAQPEVARATWEPGSYAVAVRLAPDAGDCDYNVGVTEP